MDIRADVMHLLKDGFNLETSSIRPDSKLSDELGIDSLQWVELRAWLAERGVDDAIDPGSELDTVGDIERLLDSVCDSEHQPARPANPQAAGFSLADVRPPTMRNEYFSMRPVTPETIPFLYHLAASEEIGFRWRYRGAVPSPEVFKAGLWQGIFAQFVVFNEVNSQPVGLVQLYNADPSRGTGYVGAVFIQGLMHTGLPIEAFDMFLRYVFRVWTFRKLYMEIPAYNYDLIKSGRGKYFEVEGCLKDYTYYDGRYWDEYILSLDRDSVLK
ncbi:phosphopantetheine-binding protein [Frankia sp. EAN1pec]|uniref:phosphopantetheine-binding protein n=1 Tax=Parafrankia sp. (strain EAN1pec) TaxID=298653 RepID=UPI0012F7FB9C